MTVEMAQKRKAADAIMVMNWTCPICGVELSEAPLCFGADAPWRMLVPEGEFVQRVELTPERCVVDRRTFFVRGHIEIPIRDYSQCLSLSVWSSLSEQSFRHITERWGSPERATDPPYFGWLCTDIAVYPRSMHLKISVQSRAPGIAPLFTVEPTDHPLAIDQREGISIERWHDLSHRLLHA